MRSGLQRCTLQCKTELWGTRLRRSSQAKARHRIHRFPKARPCPVNHETAPRRSGYRDYVHKPDFYVVLLHCTDQNDQEIREASPARTAKILKDMTERMKTIEEKFGHLMQINGIKGKIRKGKGKPGEAIIKAANDEGACMIVCGTRGHGKIKRAFLGSVSDYVAHHSSCPVIICRRSY
ncbi:hypothetical protein BaRGS_00018186 [Batillaria attramentaria]|uniref:UspA domain-containing protein n=1 Tax=Batillaria attramentaria TaxID=370345 RepID=A0ABD0KTL9_9CAEN